MLLKMSIVFVALCPSSSLGAGFTRKQYRMLYELKHNFCTSSKSMRGPYYADPWFCVERERCIASGRRLPDLILFQADKCASFEYGGKDPVCCYIGYIKGFEVGFHLYFGVLRHKFGYHGPTRRTGMIFYEEYMFRLYEKDISDSVVQVLGHEDTYVCDLVPTQYSFKQFVLYVPMVCTTEDKCDRIRAAFKPDTDIRVTMDADYGNHFCGRTRNGDLGNVCCHPAALNPAVTVQENWAVPTLPTDQKYASGFRTSFQCEQYAKLVCDGTTDTCGTDWSNPYGKTMPGEFPHLALIGISSPRTHFFYCSGTVVSRYMILSSGFCREYEDTDANIALTGDYDLWEYKEKESSETLSDIIDMIQSPKTINRYESDLILFILKNPLEFDRYVRPACGFTHDTFLTKTESHSRGFLPGYGTVTTGGRWSRYPKKISQIDTIKLHDGGCIKYFTNSEPIDPRRQPEYFENQHYCYLRSADGPCEFDNGVAIVYRSPWLYCQWVVFSVAYTEITNCSVSDYVLFYKPVQEWLETMVYGEDFDLFEFDVSPPTCRSYRDVGEFQHLRKSYKRLYPQDYWAPLILDY